MSKPIKAWIVVHKDYGLCLPMTRGKTKKEIAEHVKYATGSCFYKYTVERFEISPVKRKVKGKK